jgi:hypothetical protein
LLIAISTLFVSCGADACRTHLCNVSQFQQQIIAQVPHISSSIAAAYRSKAEQLIAAAGGDAVSVLSATMSIIGNVNSVSEDTV